MLDGILQWILHTCNNETRSGWRFSQDLSELKRRSSMAHELFGCGSSNEAAMIRLRSGASRVPLASKDLRHVKHYQYCLHYYYFYWFYCRPELQHLSTCVAAIHSTGFAYCCLHSKLQSVPSKSGYIQSSRLDKHHDEFVSCRGRQGREDDKVLIAQKWWANHTLDPRLQPHRR